MKATNELKKTGLVSLPEPSRDHVTKKQRILELYQAGTRDLMEIAGRVNTRPSYVARVLMDHGHLAGYFDLYTSNAYVMNVYSALFQKRLGFRDVETAKQSVQIIDTAYRELERRGDRAGQHHAEVMALTCLNRARWSGKLKEAAVFKEWLTHRLNFGLFPDDDATPQKASAETKIGI
jgi:hypothetical protein